MNLKDAAYNVVHDYPGGAESLGPRIGKNSTTLSQEVKGTRDAKLGLFTAEKITQISGDLRILQTFAANCGQMLIPLPESLLSGKDEDCMLRLADTARDFGELCKEVAGDVCHGDISDNDLARIDRDCGLLIADLHALREALAKRNLDGKPSAQLKVVA